MVYKQLFITCDLGRRFCVKETNEIRKGKKDTRHQAGLERASLAIAYLQFQRLVLCILSKNTCLDYFFEMGLHSQHCYVCCHLCECNHIKSVSTFVS
jgi:hypothetical protein